MCSAYEKTVPNLQSLVSELIRTNSMQCHVTQTTKTTGELEGGVTNCVKSDRSCKTIDVTLPGSPVTGTSNMT